MKRLALLATSAALLAGCITERPIGVELRPPRGPDGGPAVPDAVVAFELRLYRTDEGCPSVEHAASALPFAALGQVQSFVPGEEMGDVLGEVPPGRWALAVLARDAACAVHLYGCGQLDVGVTAPETLSIELQPVVVPGCGTCRTCEEGACAPLALECR